MQKKIKKDKNHLCFFFARKNQQAIMEQDPKNEGELSTLTRQIAGKDHFVEFVQSIVHRNEHEMQHAERDYGSCLNEAVSIVQRLLPENPGGRNAALSDLRSVLSDPSHKMSGNAAALEAAIEKARESHEQWKKAERQYKANKKQLDRLRCELHALCERREKMKSPPGNLRVE
jgi:hypothetical protein